jgi:hypothetical protein
MHVKFHIYLVSVVSASRQRRMQCQNECIEEIRKGPSQLDSESSDMAWNMLLFVTRYAEVLYWDSVLGNRSGYTAGVPISRWNPTVLYLAWYVGREVEHGRGNKENSWRRNHAICIGTQLELRQNSSSSWPRSTCPLCSSDVHAIALLWSDTSAVLRCSYFITILFGILSFPKVHHVEKNKHGKLYVTSTDSLFLIRESHSNGNGDSSVPGDAVCSGI